jgi:hypothetical protein
MQEGKTDFLVANGGWDWMRLSKERSSRERLRMIGEAAAKVELMDWNDTAEAYSTLCERQLAGGIRGCAA